MKKASVSGTFNRFHKGHRALIDKAFEVGDEVFIGITSDRFASSKKVSVASFEERKRAVDAYASDKGKPYSFIIVDDPLEIDKMMDMDILVVSQETEPNGMKITETLKQKGKDIELIVVPLVKSNIGPKISSSDIINELYDENGE